MINYEGLRKRPQFNDLVTYLSAGQETIRYPDRFAKQLRNHPFLTQLDGIENRMWEEQDKQKRIRQMAENSTQTAAQVKASTPSEDFGSVTSDWQTRIEREILGEKETQTDRTSTKNAGMLTDRTAMKDTGISTDRTAMKDKGIETKRTLMKDTGILTDSDQKDEIIQELERARQGDRERHTREIYRVRDQVTRELSQPSSGSVPFIDSAAAAASDVKGDVKEEDIKKQSWIQMKTIDKFMEDRYFLGAIDKDTYKLYDDLRDEYNIAIMNRNRRDELRTRDAIMDIYNDLTAEIAIPPAQTRKRSKSQPSKQKEKDVEITGVNINRTQDMNFWREQSAKEMRTQITLRNITEKGNYVYKSRDQLLDLIEGWIRNGKW